MANVNSGDGMALGMSARLKPIHEQVSKMIRKDILPLDEEFLADCRRAA